MQALQAQIERLKKACGVETDTAFADFLGISQGSISGAKKKKQIPHSWFFQVSEKANVSSDWLYYGRSPMSQETPLQPAETMLQQPVTTMETVSCVRCAKLEAKLERVEEQRDDLNAENRELWKENSELREKCARLEERSLSHGENKVIGSAG